MKALLVKCNERPVEIDIKNDWQSLRDSISVDWIEFFYPFNAQIAIVCDEEGKINGSKLNRLLYRDGDLIDAIFGNFLIVGLRADDCRSLTKSEIQKYSTIFSDNVVQID